MRLPMPIARLFRRALWLLAALAAAAARAEAPPEGAFEVVRDGASLIVRASFVVRADPSTVWRTLVDYARLPDFIPDMRASELLERRGDDVLLRQTGRAGFGPFSRQFSVTLAVREVPMREVAAQAVDGDFRRFESSYRLTALDEAGTTRIDYAASMEPKDGIPPLVGVPVMRIAMRRQFDALLAEVQRRAQAARPSAAATTATATPA
jgi:ribosome-associated toxin RatA of RatAB toxin-antitoxin module